MGSGMTREQRSPTICVSILTFDLGRSCWRCARSKARGLTLIQRAVDITAEAQKARWRASSPPQ
jgi:hypothetical protein